VLDRGARTVRLPLPAGRWRDLETGLVYEGEADVDAPVDRLPLLAACGAVTPLGGSRPVLRVDLDPVDGPLVGTRYEDDGESYAYRDGGFRRVRYRGRGGPEGFTLTSGAEGALAAVGNLLLEVHGLDDAHPEVEVDGVPAAVSFTGDGVVRIAVPAGFETVVARSTAT
jgi:alpha-glucosidase